jgi:hypothetical protein
MHAGCRIVLTGGPGGGKTTAADLFRRELGEQVVIVPEAATLLYGGGYPRYHEVEAVSIAQRVIFHLQRGLEDTQAARYPERILLCDRGTVDSAAYWPQPLGGPDDFFRPMGTSLEEQLARYDAVIFFESAAVGGISIEGGNPQRIENIAEAVALDRTLRALWSRHDRFVFVPNNPSFFKKIATGLTSLENIVAELRARNHAAR